tara:strand:+ start:2559 stop:2870 length:312 start_codon:yes stop_codon:yes gene_type:complete
MRIIGKVIKVGEVQEFSEKFRKVEVLIEQQGVKYDATIPLEFINDAIDKLKDVSEGKMYDFSINVSGREWKERYFISLRVWKVEDCEEGGVESAQVEAGDFPF